MKSGSGISSYVSYLQTSTTTEQHESGLASRFVAVAALARTTGRSWEKNVGEKLCVFVCTVSCWTEKHARRAHNRKRKGRMAEEDISLMAGTFVGRQGVDCGRDAAEAGMTH
jgi:hypothetical protein